ncbi:MaoC family dehydratase [Pseudonocardia ailaonensis]|uniref:MaoC family dehydratase n=1 Tax=Pseudonocardia ailaonensis TaxID=367279 RepID=A0ABN2MZI3_9PSEU
MSDDWYIEDFEPGQVHVTRGRTLTEVELITFVNLGGIFEEVFLNIEYAATKSLFGQRVIPALLILTVAEGLYIQTGQTHNARAYLGLDQLRFHAPTFVNDTIHVRAEVAVARLSSNPERGVLELVHEVVNQRDEVVLTYRSARMIASREHTAQ